MSFLLITVIVIACIIIYGWLFMNQPKFGRPAAGPAKDLILHSPNFKGKSFQNIHHTPDLSEGATYTKVMRDFFFNKSKQGKPAGVLPAFRHDLLHLDPQQNIFVWFGHSSYFMQIDGKTFLVDPVFSGAASPIRFTTKAFKGSDVYTVEDLPEIDYLFITHDHWDHLDYKTVRKLRPKVKQVITGLGTGAHLRHWGYADNIISEKGWNETIVPEPGFTVHTTSARHFSGRGLKRNGALWMSFVLQTPSMKIFIGGDSGYDTHFAEIGEKCGPFDVAILECGQYNEYWKYIHMMPEETVQAGIDLKAAYVIPVHWGKFSLAMHSWYEPVTRFAKAAKEKGIKIITPMIGEAVDLKNIRSFYEWWKDLK